MNLIDWKLEALEVEEFGESAIKIASQMAIVLPQDPGLKPNQVCFKGLISNGADKRTFSMRLDKGITMEVFFNAMGALAQSLAVAINTKQNVNCGEGG